MISRIKKAINVLLGKADVIYFHRNKTCPVCQSQNTYFHPIDKYYLQMWQEYSFQFSIFDFETLNVVEYACAKCGSSDRERLYAFIFKNINPLINRLKY